MTGLLPTILYAAVGGAMCGGILTMIVMHHMRRRGLFGPTTCVTDWCSAFRSEDCSDGRCRHHCKLYCQCETAEPLVQEARKASRR